MISTRLSVHILAAFASPKAVRTLWYARAGVKSIVTVSNARITSNQYDHGLTTMNSLYRLIGFNFIVSSRLGGETHVATADLHRRPVLRFDFEDFEMTAPTV